MAYIGKVPTAVPLSGADIEDGTIALADLSATGTKDSTTFLRGDNTFAEAGGGKVLQVVEGVSTTQTQTTNTSYTQSNLEVNITPSSTSSKILVISSFLGATSRGDQTAFFTIYRDATNLATSDFTVIYDPSNTGDEIRLPIAMQVLDSPSTTSQITYEVYIKSNTGTAVTLNPGNKRGSIIVMEIGA